MAQQIVKKHTIKHSYVSPSHQPSGKDYTHLNHKKKCTRTRERMWSGAKGEKMEEFACSRLVASFISAQCQCWQTDRTRKEEAKGERERETERKERD